MVHIIVKAPIAMVQCAISALLRDRQPWNQTSLHLYVPWKWHILILKCYYLLILWGISLVTACSHFSSGHFNPSCHGSVHDLLLSRRGRLSHVIKPPDNSGLEIKAIWNGRDTLIYKMACAGLYPSSRLNLTSVAGFISQLKKEKRR